MTANLYDDVTNRYHKIMENIAEAAAVSGRKAEDIIFLAATKTVDTGAINHAISLGLRYKIGRAHV